MREIATDYFEGGELGESQNGLRWQSSALLALQEATEAYVPSYTPFLSQRFLKPSCDLPRLANPLITSLTRQISRPPFRRLKPLRPARQARDDHAAGHAARTEDSRRLHVGVVGGGGVYLVTGVGFELGSFGRSS